MAYFSPDFVFNIYFCVIEADLVPDLTAPGSSLIKEESRHHQICYNHLYLLLVI